LIEVWWNAVCDACRKVLRDAKLVASDIAHVVMVGGSTRCPYVRKKVGDFFIQEPLTDIDPDCVVAHWGQLFRQTSW
jgi:molecular chaperone HscA